MPRSRPPHPGLAKVRKQHALTRRDVSLAAVRDGWWASLLERAELVSEGGAVEEDGRSVYYGSTSVRCVIEQQDVGAERLLALVLSDPHARLRVLRIAHREAVVRAEGPIHELSAEMTGRLIRDGGALYIAITVDVSAQVASLVTSAV